MFIQSNLIIKRFASESLNCVFVLRKSG